MEVLDLASIIGLIVAFALMIFGMANGDYGAAALPWFFDVPSVLITFGGTLGSVFASNTIQSFLGALRQ